jgi:hypothetical protein
MKNTIQTALLLLAVLGITQTAICQDIPLSVLPLDDLSNFRPASNTWKIVGEVLMDQQNPGVQVTAGKGVLVNQVSEKDHAEIERLGAAKEWDKLNSYKLLTTWSHGDIELEFDVMLPKGSNSGIYLQGRYEVQLYDSWGVTVPKFSDLGGIYRNWENEPGKIYLGKAPLSNPAKAPGLWQKMHIIFQAPRFNDKGEKIANAKFIKVEVNGVTIHQNVEVPLPTGGPLEPNETAAGPLMIQGDHGSVAFRNIRYRMIGAQKASLSNISYQYFEGAFKFVNDFAKLTPKASGKLNELSCEVVQKTDKYAVRYQADLQVPADGLYFISVGSTGGLTLDVDDKNLINAQHPDGWYGNSPVKIELKAGVHPIVLSTYKDASWMPPRLAFILEGAPIQRSVMQTFGSYPPDPNPESPILLSVGSKPKLLRAFLDFDGKRDQRITHSIAVGDPSGTHYIFDLKSGSIACVWRGQFINASPMWIDRGDGSFRPDGSPQYLFRGQSLGVLATSDAQFPTEYKEEDFRPKGYDIEESSSRPVFKYTYQGADIEDRIYPSDENRSLTREIKITGKTANLFCKLAEGKNIVALPDGSYQIDQQYYVAPAKGQKVSIRDINGQKELIMAVDGSSIKYAIVW